MKFKGCLAAGAVQVLSEVRCGDTVQMELHPDPRDPEKVALTFVVEKPSGMSTISKVREK